MKTKNLFIVFLLSLSASVAGQDFHSYARVGIGTGISPDFFDGIGFEGEGGVNFKGVQAALSLTLYNTLPLKSMNQSISLQSTGGETIGFDGVNRHLSGKRNTSVMISLGYDLLRFIPGNTRHHLIPYFGIGWSGLTTLQTYHNAPIAGGTNGSTLTYGSHIGYDFSSDFDFCFGGKYEYSITDKWGIGLSYKYLDLAEADLLSIYVSRSF